MIEIRVLTRVSYVEIHQPTRALTAVWLHRSAATHNIRLTCLHTEGPNPVDLRWVANVTAGSLEDSRERARRLPVVAIVMLKWFGHVTIVYSIKVAVAMVQELELCIKLSQEVFLIKLHL